MPAAASPAVLIRSRLNDNCLRGDHAALKTGSECSCRPLHSASSPVFALPDRRSTSFRKAPRA
ncbi:hypothetical protein PCL1606_38190 [Pseudomonas chlororaphis]|uniref:Uncharacterized protein n=1 Tax=Pseudomonas chlororaphis TaxID=587753 RepID=A0A0D5Y2K5_9PSED|nr:hypothetical protein PCL1606_38190 [Pseudomonas chlororaphis]